jgi:hypothetical protein
VYWKSGPFKTEFAHKAKKNLWHESLTINKSLDDSIIRNKIASTNQETRDDFPDKK